MKAFEEKLAELPDPMTPDQLAKAWTCSPDTVRYMCKKAVLKCFRVGRLWKIKKAAVIEYMERSPG